MDDLALILSHHMQHNKNGETSRKRLHEDQQEDEKSNAFKQCHNNIFENSLLFPKIEANNNTISFSKINNEKKNINIIGAQFGVRRTREQAYEHLLGERKRRQKVAKLFVSLASLLPGLNKMDRVSILEGAINLIRQLGERLEANNEKEDSSIDRMKSSTASLPQVEVRSLEEELLITILLYCKELQKGIVDEILSVIQRLHFTIKTTNFMPFGSTTMYITFIAQMNPEFCETTDFLVDKLRSSIIKL